MSAQSSTSTASDVLAVSINEAARRLGVSRDVIYRLLNTGEIRGKKIGSRTVIEITELARYLAEQPEYTGVV